MVDITAERFQGIEDFRLCLNGARMAVDGFDSNEDLVVDRSNDPTAVIAVQTALEDLTYPITPTGVYDDATAAQVRQFKIDQLLAVPPGLDQHDGVTGLGTSGRLNKMFTAEAPSVEDPEIRYTDRKSHYTNVALAKANDGAHTEWLPQAGFAANRARIVDLYNPCWPRRPAAHARADLCRPPSQQITRRAPAPWTHCARRRRGQRPRSRRTDGSVRATPGHRALNLVDDQPLARRAESLEQPCP